MRDTVRHQPFALLYELLGTHFSDIVRKGKDFVAERVDFAGRPCQRVFVRDAGNDYCLLCVFDPQGRMLDWSYLAPNSTKESPAIIETHSLSDYQDYADPSGETIYFPRKVHIRYFRPASKEGPAVMWGSDTITFRDVRFNVEIPDSQFVIALPPDAKVYDDVTGQGFLPAGSPLPAWDNPPRQARSWPWLWIAGGALLALLVVFALLAFRRRRAARSAAGT